MYHNATHRPALPTATSPPLQSKHIMQLWAQERYMGSFIYCEISISLACCSTEEETGLDLTWPNGVFHPFCCGCTLPGYPWPAFRAPSSPCGILMLFLLEPSCLFLHPWTLPCVSSPAAYGLLSLLSLKICSPLRLWDARAVPHFGDYRRTIYPSLFNPLTILFCPSSWNVTCVQRSRQHPIIGTQLGRPIGACNLLAYRQSSRLAAFPTAISPLNPVHNNVPFRT